MRPDLSFPSRICELIFRHAIALLALLCCIPANVAKAENWQASIYEEGAPGHFVGVDKKRHIFNFFERKSPLKLKFSYPCVTGQLKGDKQQINDLKTPEGIYFVEYKIANGLDFREYGGIAYTLNYPNPVDRLRGKTGHGIWIHSKGFELVPTRGCVAIDLRNISEVGPMLTPGTPVVLAEELAKEPVTENATLALLRTMMVEWSNAWSARSERLFSFYDQDAYSKATENFSAFRQNKERLFKILSFIKIYNREIHAMEGPGYWVTWSEQFYTASNLSTEGIRRLYWQKDKAGKFRIVGMEWTPRDVGMRADFLKGQLIAQATSTTVTDTASELPVAPRLDMPEQGTSSPVLQLPEPAPDRESNATQGIVNGTLSRSIAALAEKLVAISDPLVPKRLPRADPPDEFVWGKGRKLTEPQQVKQPEAVQEIKNKQPEPATLQQQTPMPPKNIQKAPTTQAAQAPLDDAANLKQLHTALEGWQTAYGERSAAIDHFYNPREYNRLPASTGIPRGVSLANLTQSMRREFAQPWLKVISKAPQIEAGNHATITTTEIMVISPNGTRQGQQKLWWKKDADGAYKIVASEFRPGSTGLEANYLEHITSDISTMLEAWRKAWEKGSIDDYMTFYTPDAIQQGRVGQRSIRRQKEQLWSRVRPSQVQLSGLRLAVDAKGIRADMNQAYTDSLGHADKGVKTLYLRFDGQKWLIQREDWMASNTQARLALPKAYQPAKTGSAKTF